MKKILLLLSLFTFFQVKAQPRTWNFDKRQSTAISYDADAQSFFTAASITDATQKSAVNQLVLDLKSAGIWTKMVAIYPIVGGNATSHSYNLKNTSLYQLTFFGSPTHTSNGVDWNGSTQYGETGLAANTLATASNHLSYYSRETTSSLAFPIDIGDTYDASQFLALRHSNGTSGLSAIESGSETNGDYITVSDATTGFSLGSRLSGTDLRLYKNGTQTAIKTTAQVGTSLGVSNTIKLGGIGGTNMSDRQCAFASIGSGLTTTEASAFYTAVQAYETTLGRNV